MSIQDSNTVFSLPTTCSDKLPVQFELQVFIVVPKKTLTLTQIVYLQNFVTTFTVMTLSATGGVIRENARKIQHGWQGIVTQPVTCASRTAKISTTPQSVTTGQMLESVITTRLSWFQTVHCLVAFVMEVFFCIQTNYI